MLSILARQTFYLICYLPSAMTGNYQLQTCYNILLVFSVSLLSLHRVCVRSVKVCPDDVTTLRRISPPHPCLQMWFWDMATCGKQIKIKYIILFLSEKSLLMVKRWRAEDGNSCLVLIKPEWSLEQFVSPPSEPWPSLAWPETHRSHRWQTLTANSEQLTALRLTRAPPGFCFFCNSDKIIEADHCTDLEQSRVLSSLSRSCVLGLNKKKIFRICYLPSPFLYISRRGKKSIFNEYDTSTMYSSNKQ